jgi:pyruvate/2-oxoglutarate/acetoin dehydrogenase E1 component
MSSIETPLKNPRYSESLNAAHHRLMKGSSDVILLGEDLLDPYGGAFKVSKGLSTSFPDQVISTPISEAGITGAAIGMAMSGMLPIVEIMFGDFITLCMDQILNHASKFQWVYNNKVRVPVVIRTPMGGRRGYGATHSQSLEAIFMGVPFLKIIAPSHFHEPGELLEKAVLEESGPVLFIENKSLYASRLRDFSDYAKNGFFFGSKLMRTSSSYPTISLKMVEGDTSEVTLITYGGMTQIVCDAVKEVFMEEEILVEILIPAQIKPLPLDDILPSVKNTEKILIVEEGVVSGGWGAELSAELQTNVGFILKKPILRIGAKSLPIPSARTLEEEVLPSSSEIKAAIHSLVSG